jgi:integrase
MSWQKTSVPGVYKDGGSYRVKWRDHTGRQRTSSHRTLADAKRAKGGRDAGNTAPPQHQRFDTYARGWIATYRGRTHEQISESTHASYRVSLERFAIPHFGSTKLDAIRPPDTKSLIAKMLQSGLSPDTVRRYLAPLKAMFAEAVEDGVLPSNPAAVMITGERKHRRNKMLTPDEYLRLRGEMPAEHVDLFDFLAFTGCRIGETLGATWQRIGQDAAGGPVFVVRDQADGLKHSDTTKTAAGERAIPLDAEFARRLIRRRASARFDRDGDPVFPSAVGTHLSASNYRRRVFNPATERAELDWVTPHVLRHSLASVLVGQGRTAAQVAAWLGHADAGFTYRTYVHTRDAGTAEGLAAAVFSTQAVS